MRWSNACAPSSCPISISAPAWDGMCCATPRRLRHCSERSARSSDWCFSATWSSCSRGVQRERCRSLSRCCVPSARALAATVRSIVVPGNHDAALVRPWLAAQGASLPVDASVPIDATPLLARVTSWLKPARVQVRYPGAWLAEGVWATHGHYLDRHLLPESAYGIARGLLGRLPRDGATPVDYEQAGGPSLTRLEALLTRWLPRPLAALMDDLNEFLRAATMPAIPGRLLGNRIASFPALLLGTQMRRASIPALARVVHRLQARRRVGHLRARPPPRAPRRRQSAALAGPGRTTAHREHGLLGARAAPRSPRHSAAPLLARRSDRARAGP